MIELAILGVVVLGTAGAFGYRAMFGGSFIPSLPPIIKPGNTPIKIVPQKDAQAAPGNQTTVPKGTGEQLVPHQEKPVEVQAANPRRAWSRRSRSFPTLRSRRCRMVRWPDRRPRRCRPRPVVGHSLWRRRPTSSAAPPRRRQPLAASRYTQSSSSHSSHHRKAPVSRRPARHPPRTRPSHTSQRCGPCGSRERRLPAVRCRLCQVASRHRTPLRHAPAPRRRIRVGRCR